MKLHVIPDGRSLVNSYSKTILRIISVLADGRYTTKQHVIYRS